MPKLMTIGEISRDHNIPIHKIDYAIASRKVEPAARVGRYRAFDPEGVKAIVQAVRDAEARQRGVALA